MNQDTPVHDGDTIAAIATPLGSSGIGIIRISGPESLQIAAALFRSPSFSPLSVRPRHLYHGFIHDPNDGNMLDEVLLCYMPAPASYTGEDVIEINLHGGILVLQKTLELICAVGARIARPGEFTRRAFCNGRIDLAQAEAIMDIIHAQTEAGLKLASRQLAGELSRAVNTLMDELVTVAAHVEASIDFPEDDIHPHQAQELADRIAGVITELRRLCATSEQGNKIRTGVQAVIAGKPNVGKSSILNALLGQYRAIVTPYPGTTRDIIHETISIQGIPVRLVDTAGLRETDHAIERIGIDMTRKRIEQADIVLIIFDGSMPLDELDRSILTMLHEKSCIAVINKNDLPPILPDEAVRVFMPNAPVVRVSALTQQGIDQLRDALAMFLIHGHGVPLAEIMVANIRHSRALELAADSLEHACEGLHQDLPFELVAVDLQAALATLGEITGRTVSDDILDTIFDTFCIGK